MLLATLACLAKATGIDKDLKSTLLADKASKSKAPTMSIQNNEDLGEVLSRKSHSPLPKELGSTESGGTKSGNASETADTASVHAKKSKKRKKKDAIDDLFKGLL